MQNNAQKKFTENLKQLIIEGMPEFKTSESKDIYLVIGTMGAGKSTTINYFMGNQMIAQRIGGVQRVIVNLSAQVKEGPAIGHRQRPETLYPRSYDTQEKTREGQTIVLCDCPGFQDMTKGKERSICESIGIELAVKSARSVRGVLVVIDYNEFTTVRSQSFVKIIATLTKLFSNNLPQVFNSLSFIINKKPSGRTYAEAKQDVLDMIDDMIVHLQEELDNSQEGYGNEGYGSDEAETEAIIECLKLMSQRRDYLTVIDPLDHGESWQTVLKQIVDFPIVNQNWFDFRQYNDNRIKFNEMVYQTITPVARDINEYHEMITQLSDYDETFKECSELISFYEQQIRLTEDGQNLEELEKQTSTLNEKMTKNYESVRLLKEKMRLGEPTKLDIDKKLQAIDNEEPVKYWEDSIIEPRDRIFGFLSWTVKEFKYPGALPVRKIETQIENGSLYSVKEDKPKGIYSATYKSHYGYDGKAKVSVYVASKLEPGNAQHIIELKNELSTQATLRENDEKQLKQLELDNEKLEKLFNELREQHIKSKEEKDKQIAEYYDEIRGYSEVMDNIAKERINLETQRQETYTHIEMKETEIAMVKKIISTLSFQSDLIESFKGTLEKYEAHILNRKALHLAILNRELNLVKYYTKQNDLLDARDKKGQTALHIAIENNYVEGAFILILEGADVTIQDNDSYSPLDYMLKKDENHFSCDEKYLLASMLILCDDINSIKEKGRVFYTQILRIKRQISNSFKPFRKPMGSIIANHISSGGIHNLDTSHHKLAFEEMRNFPELQPLLDITAFAVLGYHDLGKEKNLAAPEPLSIEIDPFGSNVDWATLGTVEDAFGVYYNRENAIYLGGNRGDKLLTRGTLIHETNHFVANEVFKNNCKPYFKGDSINEQRFEQICQEIFKRKNHVHERLRSVFSYKEHLWHIELIVRVTQLIAMTDGYSIVNKDCPELLKYYREVFLPACQAHLQELYYKNRIIKPSLLQGSKFQLLDQPASDNLHDYAEEIPLAKLLASHGQFLPGKSNIILNDNLAKNLGKEKKNEDIIDEATFFKESLASENFVNNTNSSASFLGKKLPKMREESASDKNDSTPNNAIG